MINPEQLAVCKQRGHDVHILTGDDGVWYLCRYCGSWIRRVITIEEREDEPPENERSVFNKINPRSKL